MKIKDGYIIKEVAGTNVVISVADNVSFDGILTLNETGSFLWNELSAEKTEEELVSALLKEYNVSSEQAKTDVSAFIKKLKDLSVIE